MKEKKVRHFWWELELIDIIQEYYKSDDYDPTRLILFVARIIEEEKQTAFESDIDGTGFTIYNKWIKEFEIK